MDVPLYLAEEILWGVTGRNNYRGEQQVIFESEFLIIIQVHSNFLLINYAGGLGV
jgi:hypothetical protein